VAYQIGKKDFNTHNTGKVKQRFESVYSFLQFFFVFSKKKKRKMESITKVPEPLYRFRRAVQVLGFIEILIVIVLLIILGLGLYLTQTEALLIIFEAPHVFSWAFSLGVAADNSNDPFILMTIVTYVICMIADLISVVWRIVLLVACDTNQNCDPIISIFSWITFGGKARQPFFVFFLFLFYFFVGVAGLMILDAVFIALDIGILGQLKVYRADMSEILLSIQKIIGSQRINAGTK